MHALLVTMGTGMSLILFVVFLWMFVHLLARRRMGERSVGCHGGSVDADGHAACCHDLEACSAEKRRNCLHGGLEQTRDKDV